MNLIYGKSIRLNQVINHQQMNKVESYFINKKIKDLIFKGLPCEPTSWRRYSHKGVKFYSLETDSYQLNAQFLMSREQVRLEINLSLYTDAVDRSHLVNRLASL